MKTDEKVKFYERTADLQAVKAGLDVTRQRLQGILDVWRTITDAPLTVDMITGFTRLNFLGARLPDEAAILKAVMIEKVKNSPLFGEINIDSLIAMQAKHPDISGLVAAVYELSGSIPAPLTDFGDHYRPTCFKIQGDKVVMDEDQVQVVLSIYVSYAVNTEEKHRLALAQKVVEAFESIRAEYPLQLYKAAFGGLLIYDAINDRLQPDPFFVKDGRLPSGARADLIGQAIFNASPTIGDIRSAVPTAASFEGSEADAIRQIAEKRNKVTI